MMITLMLLVLAVMASTTESSNILIYPYGHCLNSHLLNAEKMAKILTDHGHDVSMLVSSLYNGFEHNAYKNETEIQSSVHLIEFEGPANYTPICDYDNIDFFLYTPLSNRFKAFISTSVTYCEQLLSHQELLQDIKAAKFDVFIIESLDPCGRILADYFDIPFIPLVTTGLGHWDGNPRPPSYLPAVISPFTPRMTFFQRIGNLVMTLMYQTIPIIMGFEPPFEELKIKYNMNTSLSIATTINRAAIKLVNSDFAIEYPAPIEPDTVMIGGFSVDPPKPLPDHLELFMQSAENGVIVVSFGTLIKRFDEGWTKIFADAFARLPQKVIWRYYETANQTLNPTLSFSDNVKIVKWMPQADILAHPKTKAFVTHCGLNAMYETSTFGVPVVAIPMTGDQFSQASKLTLNANMGVTLDVFSLTSDVLYNAIREVVDNPEYKENAQSIADRINDKPLSTKETINYWIDYVIRHKGANHLKSVARDLPWYKYYSLDVISFVLFAIFVSFKLFIFAASKILNRAFGFVAPVHMIKIKDKLN